MESRWRIVYRDRTLDELEKVLERHPDLRAVVLQRLRALEDFPPEKWFELRRQKGRDVFTSDNQVVHISGEADPKTRTVWIHHVSVGRD